MESCKLLADPRRVLNMAAGASRITMKLLIRSPKNKNNLQRAFFLAEKLLKYLLPSFLYKKTFGLASRMSLSML
jgi:hypothetical protein